MEMVGDSEEADIRLAIEKIVEAVKFTDEQNQYYKIFVANHSNGMFRLARLSKSPEDFVLGVKLMKRPNRVSSLQLWLTNHSERYLSDYSSLNNRPVTQENLVS